jgi:hypothetical protein
MVGAPLARVAFSRRVFLQRRACEFSEAANQPLPASTVRLPDRVVERIAMKNIYQTVPFNPEFIRHHR